MKLRITQNGIPRTAEMEATITKLETSAYMVDIPCGEDSCGNPYVRRMKVPHLTTTQRIGLWLLGWNYRKITITD